MYQRNGKIDEGQHEIQDFLNSNFSQKQNKINKKCDIYSIGAIIFKLLTGRAPSPKISKHIAEKRLHANSPDQNVFNVPSFFRDYVLSNDMIYIIIKLLHQNPQCRFKDIFEVRQKLQDLRQNILQTPVILR